MTKQLYYPILLVLAILLTFILIPRDKYKQFFIYGLILGGLGDLIITILLSYLGISWFINGGVFQVGRQNILSTLSWVPVTMLFLRFLPQKSLLLYFYIVAFSAFGVFHGYVLQNARLYDFQPWFSPFGSLLVHLGAFSLIAFIFNRSVVVNKL